MKTRENELHEPIINRRASFSEYDEYGESRYFIEITCPVCKKFLTGKTFIDTSQQKCDYFEKEELERVPYYCPNCGARLKEVQNDGE